MKRWIKADGGKLSTVLEFDSGKKVELPINKDASIRWYEDRLKKNNKDRILQCRILRMEGGSH